MDSLTALADPTRRRIVELLAERERSSGEIAGQFDMTAPAISQHLKVLQRSGLVKVRVEGQRRIQVLVPDKLDEIGDWLDRTRRFWGRRLDILESELRNDKPKGNNDTE